MVLLKHNKAIRVKSLTPVIRTVKPIRPVKITTNPKHRIKPVPVKTIKSRVASVSTPRVKHAKPSVAKVVTKRRAPVLAGRVTRQLPNTRTRLQSRRPSVSSTSRKVGPSNSEAINRIKSIGSGKALVIIGNGPTHHDAPLDQLKDVEYADLMSINRPDDRLWPTKFWMFCDNSQQRRHQALWHGYTGVLINSSAVKKVKSNSVTIKSLHGKGFSNNMLKGMHIGRSSVYAAIQVGLWMNHDHIYIFGCDMSAVGGKLYPWGNNPDVTDKARLKRFKYEADNYNWMADNISKEMCKKITFCSEHNPWAFTKKFEKLGHIEAVTVIKDRHKGK